jgi:single-stranded DNA-specific DHH superfamily exonuclease
MDRLHEFIAEHRAAAALLIKTAQQEGCLPVVIVHHNDADGIAAGAILAHAFGRVGLDFRLLSVEKVHEPIIEKIHADPGGIYVYADLGGQSSGLIGRYASGSPLVIILDHHLPGGDVTDNVRHLNAERFGISGDDDASGASVCALFAGELLKEASLLHAQDEALPALLGVVGAIGDRQDHKGSLTGINLMLLEAAHQLGEIEKTANGFTIPRYLNKTVHEVVDLLNLLGAVGFYSGSAQTGVNFLLGKDANEAFHIATHLNELKTSCFNKEAEIIRSHGFASSKHFQWVDVQDRFAPMGVKAIGLFLEYLIMERLVEPDKYIIGFQYLPVAIPGIGLLEQSLTKISARVHLDLKEAIQEGLLPDFMTLIPQATALVAGTADGCHRFTAASLIQQGLEAEFIQALETILAQAREGHPE